MKKISLFFFWKNLYSLGQQRFIATLFLFAIVLFIENIFNIISKCPVELIVVQYLVFTFIITLYLSSRSLKRIKKIETIFFLSMILISPFFYFYKGGIFGSYIYLYIPVVLYILISNKGPLQKGLFMLACLTLLLVILVEYYHPEIVVRAKDKELQFFNVLINIFFDIILIALIVSYSPKLYLQKKTRNQNFIEQHRKNRQYKDVDLLSLREREVYHLIVKRNSNKEIADVLCVSTGTVKNHITSIYKKLEVNNRIEFLNKVDC